ncbi:MAG TPA: hypothetical protein PK619_00175 [bacterium]|nr:hypothetical protein [bacterium]HPN81111.1 hypothetical protein [bacterium]HPW39128.1 hypothetical protein [bacterium]
MQVQCCVCKRFRQDDGNWIYKKIDPLVERVSHTICPDCLPDYQEAIRREREEMKD